MPGRTIAGFALIAVGIVLAIFWATGRVPTPFTPVAGLIIFLVGAGLFGKTGRLAEQFQPLIGKDVRVRVWGSELPDHGQCCFRLESVRSIGPGLHFYLRPLPNRSALHLKVAQPLEAIATGEGAEIGRAKYVQSSGKKIPKNEREKAVVLIVESESG
jgi:hypothetical protein